MSRKKSFSPSPASETVAPLRSAIPSSYLPSRRAKGDRRERLGERVEGRALIVEQEADQAVEEALHLELLALGRVFRAQRVEGTQLRSSAGDARNTGGVGRGDTSYAAWKVQARAFHDVSRLNASSEPISARRSPLVAAERLGRAGREACLAADMVVSST